MSDIRIETDIIEFAIFVFIGHIFAKISICFDAIAKVLATHIQVMITSMEELCSSYSLKIMIIN